jgi:tetratricopeptide (TPR) repeat protein
MERRVSQEGPIELIDSGQYLTAEELFSERRTDDPMEMVVRAEVETYFGRFDKAAVLLEQVGPRAQDIEVAARFSLASGRLAIWRGDLSKARINLQTAYYFYRFQSDSFGLSQSLLGLARLAILRGEYDDAQAKLAEALEETKGRTTKKAEFLRGLIASEQAVVASELGEVEKATELFTEAIKLLKNTERGRHYARALAGLGSLKCSLGEYQDSLEIYKEANTIFERYFLKGELAHGQLTLGRALMRLQRYERAEKLAEESRNMRRGEFADEGVALALLALLALKRDENAQAERFANDSLDLADRSGLYEARIRARIAMGQVKLAAREFKQAADLLNTAAELARKAALSPQMALGPGSPSNRQMELEATIYLAEAYHAVDTRAGRAELARAGEILDKLDDAWLSDEYTRVSSKYEEQIMFTEDNRLVFDGNQLPKWQEAKRTLEGFLLRNALRQTNNSLTRAARKLGVSKVHVHNLKKKHNV